MSIGNVVVKSNGYLVFADYKVIINLDAHYSLETLVRFLVLVTTMVTKVDHGNHRSNDRGNHRSNHRSYYDGYYDGNT